MKRRRIKHQVLLLRTIWQNRPEGSKKQAEKLPPGKERDGLIAPRAASGNSFTHRTTG